MNRIDVSVIQPNPSKILTTENQQSNLIKHPDLSYHQESIKSPPQFMLGQGSHSRKFTIFKQLQGMKSTKSEGSLNSNRPKTQFKIPSIEDYYIKQSRENIHPNKIHRMESMIYNNNRKEERLSQTSQGATSPTLTKPIPKKNISNYIIAVIAIALLLTFLIEKGDSFGWNELVARLSRFF